MTEQKKLDLAGEEKEIGQKDESDNMMNKKKEYKAVCFTGHRTNKLNAGLGLKNPYVETTGAVKNVKMEIEALVIDLAVNHGVEYFITGGAIGVDTWAAEAVLELRKNHEVVEEMKGKGWSVPKLVVAIPCEGHDSMWPEHVKARSNAILSQADRRHLVGRGTYAELGPGCMQARNEWMVDMSQMLIAISNGVEGGTARCIRYAKEQGKAVLELL